MKKKIFIVFILLTTLTVNAQMCLTPAAFYNSYDGGKDLIYADFNNDMIIDIATTNVPSNSTSSKAISILLGNGNGTFASPINYTFSASQSLSTITAADFNHNGNTDLVVCVDSAVMYFLNGHGNGTFSIPQAIPIPSLQNIIVNLDYNHDGNIDLATTYNQLNNNKISFFLGNGNGTFLHDTDLVVGINPVFLLQGDFNGDGFVDLATGSDSLYILAGNVNGTIQKMNAVYLGGGFYGEGSSADFNNDGKIDLALCNLPSMTTQILLGTGTGTFSNAGGTNNFIWPFCSNDFNEDGNIDIASSALDINFGNGAGLFNFPLTYTYNATGTKQKMVSADFNGDGRKDIALLLDQNTPNVAVFLNSNDITGLTINSKNISCHGAGDGWAHVTAAGHGINNQYTWTNSVYPTQYTDSATNLSYGVYLVTVTGQSGCTYSGQVFISEPNALQLDLYNSDFSCAGTGNPSPTCYVNGGTTPYTYLWNNTQTSGSLSNVTPGIYDVKVTDANGCRDSISGNFGLSPQIQPASVKTFTNTPAPIICADFNGDGKTDIASYYSNSSNNIFVLLGNGLGSLGTIQTYSTGLSIYDPLSNFFADDFTNDGNTDLVIGCQSGKLVCFPGTGTGSFLANIKSPTGGSQIWNIQAHDFNADGKKDIAVINTGNKFDIYGGNGNGNFSLSNSYTLTNNAQNLILADLNNDGNIDAVCGGNSLAILLGASNGLFASPIYLPYNFSSIISVADFNGDGYLDIAGVNYSSSLVNILAGSGTGSFSMLSTLNTGINTNLASLTASDIDLDGKTDLLVSTGGGIGNLNIFKGDGNGNFYTPTHVMSNNNGAGYSTLADFNMDGSPDIISCNTGTSNTIKIDLNCRQVNGIETINKGDLLIYPNPNNGEFVVRTNSKEKQQVQLIDVNGNLIISADINANTSFSVKELQNGVYTIIVRSIQEVFISKLILVK